MQRNKTIPHRLIYAGQTICASRSFGLCWRSVTVIALIILLANTLRAQDLLPPDRMPTETEVTEQESAPTPGSDTPRPPRVEYRRVDVEETTSSEHVNDSATIDREVNRLSNALGLANADKLDMIFIECKNLPASMMKEALIPFVSPQGMINSTEKSNVVAIVDQRQHLERIKVIAARFDKRVPQVMVEAQIIELTIDDDFEKDVNLAFEHLSSSNMSFVKNILSTLSAPGANVLSGQGGALNFRPYVKTYDNGNKRNELSLFFRFMESRGRAKILSSPNLILQNGVEGSIITGEEVPVLQQTVLSGSVTTTTEFKEVGVKLKVTPLMIAGNTVRLEVYPEVSTVTGFTESSSTGISNPIIAVRSARTQLEMKDGELIALGGLIKSEERTQHRKVPVLGDLPTVRHLFRSRREQAVKTQLVIFLKLRILKEGMPGDLRLHQPSEVPGIILNDMDKENSERIHNLPSVPYEPAPASRRSGPAAEVFVEQEQ